MYILLFYTIHSLSDISTHLYIYSHIPHRRQHSFAPSLFLTMYSILSPVSLSIFLLFSQAWTAPAGQQRKGAKKAVAPQAIYFISNNDGANSVAALPVTKNGSISTGTMTPTGGAGASMVDPTTRLPESPDALSSQGAVRVVGNVSLFPTAFQSTRKRT